MNDAAAAADAVVMAAAVADFRPEVRSGSKIKKSCAAPAPIQLAENPDILRELSAHRARPGQREPWAEAHVATARISDSSRSRTSFFTSFPCRWRSRIG